MTDIPSIVDVDKTLDTFIRNELVTAQGDAVMAEIAQRQYEILDQLQPGRDDVIYQREQTAVVATARRQRADGLAARLTATTGTTVAAGDVVDMRLDVALKLQDAEATQVGLDERANHLDLYAVTADEAAQQVQIASVTGRGMVFPLTEAQILLNQAQGRARVQALAEWLDQHGDGPAIEDAPANPQMQRAADALKTWLSAKGVAETPTAENATADPR